MFLIRSCPQNWLADTIVATCNPPRDERDYGESVAEPSGEFDTPVHEHSSDLLDHTVPLSVSDPRRRAAFTRAKQGWIVVCVRGRPVSSGVSGQDWPSDSAIDTIAE